MTAPHQLLKGIKELARLPEPDPEAAAHSARLVHLIRREIESQGESISFARYMELALYAPGFGYYSAGTHKFGAEGDFVTAPEISPLFSCCLARQCLQVLEELGGGSLFEFGAGTGVMAADILSELHRLGKPPEQYLILELSAELRKRQRTTLEERIPELLPRVRWLDSLPRDALQGVVLANEVLDALPTERFRLSGQTISELGVGWEDERFVWRTHPCSAPFAQAVAILREQLSSALSDGYESELNLRVGPWIKVVAETLVRGVVLLIDYGYPRREFYHPERCCGTLMCYYRHRAHSDPLILTGLQDITSHVDFTAVAEAAVAAGFEVPGFTTQACFLLACGITNMLDISLAYGSRAYLEQTRQIKLLTLPGEMGEHIKVLALAHAIETPLMGFTLQDHRGRL
jgi:Uncharacterized conserved protein